MSTLHLKSLEIALDAVLALGTLKLYPMAVSFTPNANTQSYFSDISASVASGAAAVTLTGVVTTIDTVNNRVELDTDNAVTGVITTSTNKYSLVVDTGVAATSPVLATIDLVEGTVSTVAGTITFTINSEGHFALKAT
jgi:dihydroorotase-like cyclic amidohydrolase